MASPNFAAGAYAAVQRIAGAETSRVSLPAGETAEDGGFAQLLKNAIGSVAASGKAADTQTLAAADGKADLVQVVTAVAESQAAMQTLVAVRDKVISAYEDVMRMAI